ncbi:MAG TPA: hypothetical protein EYG89_05320 [Bacteroidia bacterium]|nr:hypothetical protein [Bacteroidia bacterium]
MLKSFFFIPGNHSKLIEKIDTIKASQIVIDLEDAFDNDKIAESLTRIKKISNLNNLFFRIDFFDNDVLKKDVFTYLINLGVNKFVIPKFKSLKQLKLIEKLISNNSKFSFILLIENPNSLFSLQNILSNTKLKVIGLGFGSHDYCNEIGMKHNIELLYYPRFLIAGLAKAFNITSIDIACMEIDNKNVFLDEIKSAYSYGFDAKFIIHPKQLNLLKYPDEKELNEAKEIIQVYNNKGKPTIFKYNGKAIEPPHIKYYINLIKNHK